MATARVIPKAATDWPIDIVYVDSTSQLTVSPAGIIIGADDTITFNNNSANATITITFEPNPPGPTLFEPSLTPDIDAGTSYSPEGPLAAAGSVNYYVTVGSVTFGPYAIQVGTTSASTLYVQVANGECTPGSVSIPKGGWLEMFSTDGENYGIEWTITGNPLPGLTEVHSGVSNPGNGPFQNPPSGGPIGPIFAYGLKDDTESGGGGTIKVQ
jgi:hypothetical protein